MRRRCSAPVRRAGQLGNPVLPGQCQLGRRERHPLGDRVDAGKGVRLAVGGGAQQLAGLAAKLI
jgi:hypothetical protein